MRDDGSIKVSRAIKFAAKNMNRYICLLYTSSFCGAGVDGDTLKIAKERGAQALISADIKHNYICEALDLGMNVIELTHYASENYGFHKIYQNLKDKLGVASRCV